MQIMFHIGFPPAKSGFSTFPSSNSREAPPPVLQWVTWGATPTKGAEKSNIECWKSYESYGKKMRFFLQKNGFLFHFSQKKKLGHHFPCYFMATTGDIPANVRHTQLWNMEVGKHICKLKWKSWCDALSKSTSKHQQYSVFCWFYSAIQEAGTSKNNAVVHIFFITPGFVCLKIGYLNKDPLVHRNNHHFPKNFQTSCHLKSAQTMGQPTFDEWTWWTSRRTSVAALCWKRPPR